MHWLQILLHHAVLESLVITVLTVAIMLLSVLLYNRKSRPALRHSLFVPTHMQSYSWPPLTWPQQTPCPRLTPRQQLPLLQPASGASLSC